MFVPRKIVKEVFIIVFLRTLFVIKVTQNLYVEKNYVLIFKEKVKIVNLLLIEN